MRVTTHHIIAVFLLVCGAGCGLKSIHYQIEPRYAVDDPQFTQTIGNLLGPALLSGNRVETLRNGDQIFPAMLSAIASASKSITFETYVYWSGDIGTRFTDALCERAKAGVKTHVLIDWAGSDKIDRDFLRRMRECGVEVERYHPFHVYDPTTLRQIDHRTHRKILVVDGKLGFTGGVGIADVWRGNADAPDHWRDNHYRIHGPAVAQLQAVFMGNWMQTTGEVLHGEDYFPPLEKAGEQQAQVFKSAFTGGSESMQLLFLLSIAAATKDIRMECSYFVPDGATIQALLEARRRGVRLQIIVPGPKIDEKLVRRASRATWGALLKEGVEIYEYQPTMFHCKQLVIDDRWVSIGSSNMDNRSFRLNDEANLNVFDTAFAADQIRIFEEDKGKARQITWDQWEHRPLHEKLMEILASLGAWEL